LTLLIPNSRHSPPPSLIIITSLSLVRREPECQTKVSHIFHVHFNINSNSKYSPLSYLKQTKKGVVIYYVGIGLNRYI
jgi:hypothetical protein